TKRDLYLYEPGSESSVFPPGRNDDEEDDVQCALDSSGTYVAWQVQTSEDVFFKLLDRSSGQLVDLPAPERFTLNPVWLTDPYPPAVPISGQGRDRTAPRFLGRVRVTNGRFRAARTSARRSPVGTAFIYRLSEKATVRITIERRLRGRRVGRRCLKPTARNRSGRRCARWRRRGQITASATAGRNSTRFSGRVRKRRLRPGRYRARLIATDPAGNSSSERRVSFTIVRR
ncbi:MAG TPA: hypothetical protein VF170_02315, partial [Planctomycetaceae bacterium]